MPRRIGKFFKERNEMANRVIEFRILLREEVSSIEHLPDVEQMAEQLKDAIYDSDPHSTYIEDVFYEVVYVVNEGEEEDTPKKKLTRTEKLQAAADAGVDTWEDYRGER
jgi:hypothetical protein